MAQISMEAALVACREKLGEITYENVLLRAQVTEADRRIAELEQQAPPVPGPDTGDARPA